MSEDLSHYVPRRLDDASKFLFWDMDVAGVAMFGMMFGVYIGMPVMGLLFGVVLAYAYGRLKVGKHPGLASHWLYWYTGAPQPKELPPSHLRELNG